MDFHRSTYILKNTLGIPSCYATWESEMCVFGRTNKYSNTHVGFVYSYN